MNPFKKLSSVQKHSLLKFPAYISILAASSNDKLDEAEKKAAMKFAHTKTFTCDPLLSDFYLEAEKVFEKNIEQLDKSLPKEKDSRDEAIKKELLKLEKIVRRLGQEYSSTMHNSMKSFSEHVSKAHHNVLIDFIIPVSIPGLNE
jgi:hypothetical protein